MTRRKKKPGGRRNGTVHLVMSLGGKQAGKKPGRRNRGTRLRPIIILYGREPGRTGFEPGMGGKRALRGQVGKKTLSGGKGTLRGRKKNRLQARNGRKRSPRRAEKKPFAAGKRSKKNPARAKTCTEWNRAKVKYQHGTGGKEAPDGRKRNPSQPENGLRRTLRGRKPGRNEKGGKKTLAGGGMEP